MTFRVYFLVLISTIACCTTNSIAPWPGPIESRKTQIAAYRSMLEELADDAMLGRGIRTKGNEMATAAIEKRFKSGGLLPGFGDGYRQCFDHPLSISVAKKQLTYNGQGVSPEAFAPAAFSASGVFEGDVVFVGYGIHAPEQNYDDYAGLDVTGKTLLMLRFEPREDDPTSPLNGEYPSKLSGMRRKVFEAKSRGAKAVLFVAAPKIGDKPDTQVPSLDAAAIQSDAGLAVVHLLPSLVDAWLAHKGTTLTKQVAVIDKAMASRALPLGHIAGHVTLERTMGRLCNVVGLIPGVGHLAEQRVVVGAHFDHLGLGGEGSMDPDAHAIHNGADDNASGTAGLMAVARMMLAQPLAPNTPRRTVVFIAFNGEESGLAGSSAYVKDPSVSLKKINAMLNMDMIGRLRNNQLSVLGTQSAQRLTPWLATGARLLGLTVNYVGDGYGPSDQTPFYSGGVPVLHFFTGAHDDYHRPTDDADKINYQGAMQVIKLVAGIARYAANDVTRLVYRETNHGGATMGGDVRHFGAWLGTVPDYSAMAPDAAKGVLLSGVRKGGPAQLAGIRAGDTIVGMGGKHIDNLYDMTFVLRSHRPGDVINVIVVRLGQTVALTATLGARRKAKQPKNGQHHSSSQVP